MAGGGLRKVVPKKGHARVLAAFLAKTIDIGLVNDIFAEERGMCYSRQTGFFHRHESIPFGADHIDIESPKIYRNPPVIAEFENKGPFSLCIGFMK
jgi:hypothetical protein